MKILAFILIAIIGFTSIALAREPISVSLRVGETKAADGGKVSIKFLSVEEDSRCPVNARCVWAGNAKIKIAFSAGRAPEKIIELNSTLEPKDVVVYGYEIKFGDLTPRPGETDNSAKTATIILTRRS